ncbi:hypothetical protein J8273_3765 [Carpediemonas membranifera]|uniref:CPC1/SPEF2 domain-containing protein n=1 Tax=Carpediemonas membranifera TaxID=201153 RepID=A0A8J6B396_9EUKA|nr:hypothetical protein J8273_3765 [Carpediemonas membranifera]|eukprot:KAG9394788.1 hypothetical protein J8273_3765 [Carpediemonas membranifera]
MFLSPKFDERIMAAEQKVLNALFRQSEAERRLCARLLEVELEKDKMIENRELRTAQCEEKAREWEEHESLRFDADCIGFRLRARDMKDHIRQIYNELSAQLQDSPEASSEDKAVPTACTDPQECPILPLMERLSLLAFPPAVPGPAPFVPGFVAAALTGPPHCGIEELAKTVCAEQQLVYLDLPLIVDLLEGNGTADVPQEVVDAVTEPTDLEGQARIATLFVRALRAVERVYSEEEAPPHRGVLVCGYPATKEQAEALEQTLCPTQDGQAPLYSPPRLPSLTAVTICKADIEALISHSVGVVRTETGTIPVPEELPKPLPELAPAPNSMAVVHAKCDKDLSDLEIYYDSFHKVDPPVFESVDISEISSLIPTLTTCEARLTADNSRADWAQAEFAVWQGERVKVCPSLTRHVISATKPAAEGDDGEGKEAPVQKSIEDADKAVHVLKLGSDPVEDIGAAVSAWFNGSMAKLEARNGLEKTAGQARARLSAVLHAMEQAMAAFSRRELVGYTDALDGFVSEWNDVPARLKTEAAVASVFLAKLLGLRDALVTCVNDHYADSAAVMAAAYSTSGASTEHKATYLHTLDTQQGQDAKDAWADMPAWALDSSHALANAAAAAIKAEASRVVEADTVLRELIGLWGSAAGEKLSLASVESKEKPAQAKGKVVDLGDPVLTTTTAVLEAASALVGSAVCPSTAVAKGKDAVPTTPEDVASEMAEVFESFKTDAAERIKSHGGRLDAELDWLNSTVESHFDSINESINVARDHLREGVKAVLESIIDSINSGRVVANKMRIDPILGPVLCETIAADEEEFDFDPTCSEPGISCAFGEMVTTLREPRNYVVPEMEVDGKRPGSRRSKK